MADEKKAKKTEAAGGKKSDKKSDSKKTAKKSDKKKSGKNPFKSIGSFFKSVRSEGKKVVWPKPLEVLKNTLVVLVVILILGLIIFGIDQALTQGMKGIKKLAEEQTTVAETVDDTDHSLDFSSLLSDDTAEDDAAVEEATEADAEATEADAEGESEELDSSADDGLTSEETTAEAAD